MEKDRNGKTILAVDHGTSGMKVSLLTASGRVLDSAFEATPIRFLPGGGAEQDPDDWWNALVRACRAIIGRAESPADVEAVAVSSTFSSTVAVDAGGNHVMNSLTWMDSRGAPHVKAIMRGFPSIAGYGLANLLRWVPRTGGGPTLSGKDDIAHVLLIKHEFPEVYEKTRAFLPSKDYLNLRLTGELAASYDSMSLFWIIHSRDINNLRYDDGLIRRLGIDRHKLPPLVSSTAILGNLTRQASDELGLPSNVRVVAGSPDHQSALVGSGAVRDFEGHLYVGTSSWIECLVPFKKTDVLHSIASLPSAVPGRYQCINEQDLAGGCLSFLADNILFSKELWSNKPADQYAFMDSLAEAVPTGSDGLIFTPWLNGERTPIDDHRLRGGFHNMSKTTTLAHMVRSVLEGVALNTRWSLKYVERFVGRRLDPLTIVGGGGRSDLWCRIFADILDRTIRRIKNPIQANARGAALIAAVGLGHIGFEDIPGLTEHDAVFEPNPRNRDLYDRLFSEFLAIYKRNRGIYRRLNG